MTHTIEYHHTNIWISRYLHIGWLRLVGSLKLYVSLENIGLFCRALLQKRLIILRSLLSGATPYEYYDTYIWISWYPGVCVPLLYYIHMYVCMNIMIFMHTYECAQQPLRGYQGIFMHTYECAAHRGYVNIMIPWYPLCCAHSYVCMNIIIFMHTYEYNITGGYIHTYTCLSWYHGTHASIFYFFWARGAPFGRGVHLVYNTGTYVHFKDYLRIYVQFFGVTLKSGPFTLQMYE